MWKRYVDDSFCIIKRNAVNSFHTTLNSIDPHISFTIEEESDQQIAFLDTPLVSRKNNTITIDVFRKATHTDRYLDFFLIMTKAIRSAQLRPSYTAQPNSLIQHKGKITKSTTSLMLYELTTIPLILFLTSSRRNFPNHPHMPSLHQKNLFACFFKWAAPLENSNSYAVLPFINGVTQPLTRILRRHEIQVINKPLKT